uniref:Protein patched homolog 1 n=3 Tax=Saccoglossus kowalevskii TaxID=10224 RepID=A0ABM0MRQ1_SACKO|nr:PREDICTED: protein patched homolog 1 [Saccoglossus kowalevskii]
MADRNDDLLTRTSWCDARHAQKEIDRGRAHGNKAALWLRVRIQAFMFHIGCVVQQHYGKVLIMGMLILACLIVGIKFAVVETNVEKLWVEAGGRLQEELKYTTETLGVGEGTTQQIIIQTPNLDGTNILSQEALEIHLQSALAATKVEVEMYGKTWDLGDVCFKADLPSFEDNLLQGYLEVLVPCILITPLDCFWEGSKLLGPYSPIHVPFDLDIDLVWTKLDPLEILENLKDYSDYFGDLDALFGIFETAGIGHAYQTKPCLNPEDPDCPEKAPNKYTGQVPDITAELTGGCSGYASKYMEWPEELIVGGVQKNHSGNIKSGEALQTIVELMGEQQMYQKWVNDWKINDIDWTQEKAKAVLEEWQRKFTKVVSASNNNSQSQNVMAFSSTTFNDLLQEFSQTSMPRVAAGYVIMLIYACITMMKFCDGIQSQGGVGLGGVLLVATAVLAGLAVCAMIGIEFNAATTQVLPFVALGIGVDDMFLLAHTSSSLPSSIPVAQQTGEILKRSGMSVLLTSLNNMCAFFIAAVIPIPALRTLSLQFAIIVVFNFVAVIFIFPAILALDIERREARRIDLFCCFSSSANRIISVEPIDLTQSPQLGRFTRYRHQDPRTHVTLQSSVQAVTQMPARPGEHCVTVVDSVPFTTVGRPDSPPSPPGSRTLTPQSSVSSAPSTRPLTGKSIDSERPSFRERCTGFDLSLKKFAKCYYGPFLTKMPVKIVVLIFFTGLLGVSAYGIVNMRDGLDITDVVPRKTQEYDFLEAQMKYFSFYNMFAVTQDDFDYANSQRILYQYHDAFREIGEVIRTPDNELPMFWLQYFRDWLLDIQEAFDNDWLSGAISQNGPHKNATEYGVIGYKLIIQTGDSEYPIDETQVNNVRLVDEHGIIYPDAFYNYLTVWWSYDVLSTVVSQAQLHPEPHNFIPGGVNDPEKRIPKSQALNFTQIPFFLNGLQTTEDFINVINKVRNISSHFDSRGLPNYPRGIPFTFWEQYVNLRFFLMLALISVLGATFLVNTIILVNPWAALIEVCVLAMMLVELFGFMGIIGLKMSAIPAVTLIFSVGASVEFTLHILLSFMSSIGDRNRRMCMALEHMFAPVVDGAISTLLGVIMLSGAEFEFIVRYFFYVFTILIIIGLLNGLVLLPVLLSLVGPPAEVVPNNNADRLDMPTPEPTPPLDHGLVMHSIRRNGDSGSDMSRTSSGASEGFRHGYAPNDHIQIHPPEFVVETLTCHTPPREKAKRMSRRSRRKDTKLHPHPHQHPHQPTLPQQVSSSSSSSLHSSPSLARHVTTVTATARVSIVHRGACGVDKGESGHSYKSHRRRDDLKFKYPAVDGYPHCDTGSDTSV